MNSKQINFFALEGELPEIQDWLLGKGSNFIKQPIGDKNNLFDNGNSQPNGEIEYSQLFICRDKSFENIFLKSSKNGYYIDILKSNVIEFDRPVYFPKTGLTRSRLYFVTGFYDEENRFIRKNEDFLRWCDMISQQFKKQFLIKFKTKFANYATKGFVQAYHEDMKLDW